MACTAGVALTGPDEEAADGRGPSADAASDLGGVLAEALGSPEAVVPDCRPMDAKCPSGTCCPAIGDPPFRWEGRHYANVGCNCRCVGDDCDSVFESLEECVAAYRTCYPHPVHAHRRRGSVSRV